MLDDTDEPLFLKGPPMKRVKERAQVAEALRASELRYRRFSESAKDGILILDALTGQIMDVNPFLLQLLGHSREELLGKQLWEISPFKEVAGNQEAFKELQAKAYMRYEHPPLETKDGRRVAVEFVSNSYQENGDRIIQCNVLDITERKRVEEASSDNQHRLALATESARIGVWDWNVGNELRWDQRMYALYGIREQDFDGAYEAWRKGLHPEDVAWADAAVAAALDGTRDLHTQFRVMWPNGEVHHIEAHAIVERAPDGAPLRMIGVNWDITERKRSEAEHAHLAAIVDSSDDAILSKTLDGIITSWNRAAERLYGYSAPEVVGRPISVLVPPDQPDEIPQILEQLRRGEHIDHYETVRMSKDGTRVAVYVTISPIRGPSGKLIGASVITHDISARRRAEAALRESEERFRRLFESSRDALMTLEPPSWRFTSGNPAAVKMFGAKNEEELISRRPSDLSPERQPDGHASAEKAKEMIETAVREGAHFFEWTHRRIGGEEFPAEVLLTRVEQGGKAFLQATVRDITARKRGEEQLVVQSTALASAANAITITDTDGQIIWVNPAFTQLTGYASEEVIGCTPRLLKSGTHDRAFYEHLWGAIRSGQVWSGELVNQRKDGTLYTEELTIAPVRQRGVITHFVGIQQDITARKQGEEALRASEARFRELSESLPQLIWTCRADGACDYLSPQWVDYTGIPEQQQHGLGWLEQIHQDDRHRTLTTWNAMAGPGRSVDLEFRIRRKDGVYRWFKTRAVAVRDDQGRVVKWFGTNTDIEDQKQAEASLRVAQRLEALGTLAGGIAHDFNNILGAIIGNAELARQDVGPGHPATESLTEIRKASHRAKDLVQRILVFGRQQQQPQAVIPLPPIVEEAVALLRTTLPAGVGLTTVCDADTPTVLADPTQIHQVLMNLCTNSWHAMNGHSGRIDIRLEGITLDAEVAVGDVHLRPGRFARLCITDNGSGMGAATLERIFEPFFTTKPVGQGTGLGLSVVHGIVIGHGGAISVRSEPDTGTTFSLYFPAAEAPQPDGAPATAVAAPLTATGGQHVLYLDDEEPLVFLVTRLLERLGYRVSGYTQAAEALAAVGADSGQFDLMVTDMNMPGISGLEVARAVACLRPRLPVVLASGHITDALRAQAAEAGVQELIYKPNMVEELCDVVHRQSGAPKTP